MSNRAENQAIPGEPSGTRLDQSGQASFHETHKAEVDRTTATDGRGGPLGASQSSLDAKSDADQYRLAISSCYTRQQARDTFARHRCDVTSCVNPTHLFVGTPADNSADAAAKGLYRKQSKLTPTAVRAIRELLTQDKSCAEIALRFGVSDNAVSHIKRGLTWRHVV